MSDRADTTRALRDTVSVPRAVYQNAILRTDNDLTHAGVEAHDSRCARSRPRRSIPPSVEQPMQADESPYRFLPALAPTVLIARAVAGGKGTSKPTAREDDRAPSGARPAVPLSATAA